MRLKFLSPEALAEFREAVDMSLRMFGDEHPQTARSRTDYGVELGKLERYAEAERNLISAFDVYVADLGEDHVRTKDVAQSLVRLYEHMGEADKGDRYREYMPE